MFLPSLLNSLRSLFLRIYTLLQNQRCGYINDYRHPKPTFSPKRRTNCWDYAVFISLTLPVNSNRRFENWAASRSSCDFISPKLSANCLHKKLVRRSLVYEIIDDCSFTARSLRPSLPIYCFIRVIHPEYCDTSKVREPKYPDTSDHYRLSESLKAQAECTGNSIM